MNSDDKPRSIVEKIMQDSDESDDEIEAPRIIAPFNQQKGIVERAFGQNGAP